jgi:hypothetical protein
MIDEVARGHGHLCSLAGMGEEGCLVGSDDAQVGARSTLGVLARDRVRTIVVVTADGELAVAIRDAVPPGAAVVRDARDADAAAIAAACLPWPWMVVGATAALAPALAASVRTHPVITFWLGAAPPGSPAHMRCFDRPRALIDAIRGACAASVGGMRLAPGSGVELCDGTLVRGATLDALIGSHPRGFDLPARTFRTVADALARHDAGWRPVRGASTRIALVRCAAEEVIG